MASLPSGPCAAGPARRGLDLAGPSHYGPPPPPRALSETSEGTVGGRLR